MFLVVQVSIGLLFSSCSCLVSNCLCFSLFQVPIGLWSSSFLSPTLLSFPGCSLMSCPGQVQSGNGGYPFLFLFVLFPFSFSLLFPSFFFPFFFSRVILPFYHLRLSLSISCNKNDLWLTPLTSGLLPFSSTGILHQRLLKKYLGMDNGKSRIRFSVLVADLEFSVRVRIRVRVRVRARDRVSG